MSLRHISLLIILISCEGRGYMGRIFPKTIADLTNKENNSRRARNDVYYIKLSPVPFDVEAPGSQSPPGGIGTQFGVLLAPSAPSNNFILQPILHGSNHQHLFTSDGPYYIDHQGHLVQRPDTVKPLNFHEAPPVFPHLTDDQLAMLGQPLPSHHTQDNNQPNNNSGFLDDVNETVDQRPRPGISPVPSIGSNPIQSEENSPALSIVESSTYLMSPSPTYAPLKPSSTSQTQNLQLSTSFPQSILPLNNPTTSQHHHYTPQQPTYSPQYAQSSSKYPQTVAAKPSQTVGQQQQTPLGVQAPQPAASANPSAAIIGQPSLIYKPRPPPTDIVPVPPEPSPIKPLGGVYIATVNHGPGQPSSVFTCVQTHLLNQTVLESGEYSPGPQGYSCKASRRQPFLSNHLLSAKRQSPVPQEQFQKNLHHFL